MTNYLEVTNLSKSFDSFQLHNISFTLPKGYIMGLIGPNGSGKTTTIKLILNMLLCNLLKTIQKGGSRWGQVLYMVR